MQNISCNLCGRSDAKLLFTAKDINYKTTDETFSVVQCGACGFVYINPQPEQSELTAFYPDTYRPYRDKTTIAYRAPESPSKYILDIGSGPGSFLAELHEKDPSIALFGVDFDKRAVETGRLRGFPIFHGSLLEARYAAAFFDEAHMSHLLEHVLSPLETLQETARILKPGGKLIITIPNFASFSRMLFGKYWYHLDAPRHLYHFTPRTLGTMLEKAGFKNISFGFIPSPKYFLQSYAFWKYGGKRKFSKLTWHFLTLPAKAASFLKLSSTMKVIAEK